jgi:hypothetical protein
LIEGCCKQGSYCTKGSIWWSHHFKNVMVATMTWLTYFMTYHRLCNTTGVTSGAGIAYPSGAPDFTPVFRVTRSLVLCVCFVDRCLCFCTFSFGHCVVFFFDRFWLPLWYLQTLLSE